MSVSVSVCARACMRIHGCMRTRVCTRLCVCVQVHASQKRTFLGTLYLIEAKLKADLTNPATVKAVWMHYSDTKLCLCLCVVDCPLLII